MKIVPFLRVLQYVQRFLIALTHTSFNLQQFSKLPYRLRFGVIILSAQIITQAQTIAQTQVIPDGTLSTTVSSPDNQNVTINNGDRAGNNLFHSFLEFSVPTNGSAVFNNANDIENIFSRITGVNISNIDGLIQTNGAANLFLLNPNGIFLGPDARLDIGGSFVGTTATSIEFADGVEFSAAETAVNPILTMGIPIGLQMGQNPGTITSQAAYFETKPEKSLALIGGGIFLQGISDDFIDFAYLYASDGHIELGSVGDNSLVTLTPSPTGWAFSYDDINKFGDIILDRTFVEASGNGGGTIQLQGDQVQLTGVAQIYTTTTGAVSGGGITIQARDFLTLMGTDPTGSFSSGLFSSVTTGAEGNGGDINIDTPSLRLIDGGVIQVSGEGQGSLGNLTVQADHIEILDRSTSGQPSNIVSSNYGSAQIPGGNISLNTQTLTLANGGRINLFSRTDKSDSGNLIIRAHTIDAFGNDESTSPVQTLIAVAARAGGNGGTADIITDQLTLRGDAQLFVGTQQGAGTGGNLKLQATDIYFDRAGYSGDLSTGINISTGEGTQGDAGTLDLQTQRLTLLNGAQVFGGTAGSGNGGLLRIQADDIIISETGTDSGFNGGAINSSITTEANSMASGNAGNIELQTSRLYLGDGGAVFSGVLGNGDGGNISIQASEVVATGAGANGPSGIIASLGTMSVGRSGRIDINSDSLVVQEGATISSETAGMGDAGIIRIQATDLILVDGSDSQIQSDIASTAVGKGGQIDLFTSQLQVSNGGSISTESVGQGDAGNIDIQAEQVSLLNNAIISSQSTDNGDAGNIILRGDSLTLRNTSSINAATALGDGGNLNLTLTDYLYIRNASQLTAEADGIGNGGNISIRTPIILAIDNSDIIANAVEGDGGNISIAATTLLGLELRNVLTPGNDITASSQFGMDGIVQIETPGLDPSQGTVKLPSNPTDPSNQISTGCMVAADNSLTISGRGGLPANPANLNSVRTWEDWRPLETNHAVRASTVSAPSDDEPLIEASSSMVNANGQVELIASKTKLPTNTNPSHCGARASLEGGWQ